MKNQAHVPTLLAAALVALAGCSDGFTEPEVASVADDPSHVALPVPVETTLAPGADVEALELSAGVRTAMTRTLTAALAELDLQPDAPLSVLHDFFQQAEAQHAEALEARAEPLRTIQP